MALNVTLVVVLMLLAGLADSFGFVHAFRIWRGGTFEGAELLKSAAWFTLGLAFFWLSIKYMNEVWDLPAEIKTTLWFAATIVGVAAINGSFFQWRPADQLVSVGVLSGLVWLLWRTGS